MAAKLYPTVTGRTLFPYHQTQKLHRCCHPTHGVKTETIQENSKKGCDVAAEETWVVPDRDQTCFHSVSRQTHCGAFVVCKQAFSSCRDTCVSE